MKNKIDKVMAVMALVLCGAIVMAAVSDMTALRLTPTTQTGDATVLRVDNTSGVAQLSMVASTGVATFAAAPVFSAGIGATTFTTPTFSGTATFSNGGTLDANGVVDLGDGGDTFAVASTGLDITTAGAISNATTIAGTGISTTSAAVSLGDGTSTFAVASTGLDITTAGAISNATTIAGTGISTTSAAVSLGDGTSTFAVASTGLDVSTAGAISNATTIAMSGALSGATTGSFSGALTGLSLTASNGSVSATDTDGFNTGSGSLVSGVPTMRMDVVAGTAGAEDVVLDACEAGSAANWTPGGGVAPTDADTAVTYRIGSGAVAVTYGDVGIGDATETLATGGNWDASADEYIFLWVHSTAALSAGTLTLDLIDSVGNAAPVNIGAVAANVWTLVRVDISAIADADKDVVTDLVISSNHATELDSAVVTFDEIVKVDNAESTALAFNAINQPGGVRSGFSFVEDAGNGTFVILVEYTDFFVDYVNDRVYWMTDQSTLNDVLLYASST